MEIDYYTFLNLLILYKKLYNMQLAIEKSIILNTLLSFYLVYWKAQGEK
jgi:hypothetical protein